MKAIKIIFSIISIIVFWSFVPEKIPSSARSTLAIQSNNKRLEAEFNNKHLKLGSPIFLRIFKAQNELELWVEDGAKFSKFKTYKICYFSGIAGPKTKQGDGQSPEGFYFIKPSQMNPWSDYHLSFNLGYPNKYDRAQGYTGNYLMIHGSCVSIGCYAMTDETIEELWTIASKSLEQGQPFFRVHSFPFPLTNEKLELYKEHKNYTFWKNLQEGYFYFENNKIPPNVDVVNKKYVFS